MSIDEIVKNFIDGRSGIVEYSSLEEQDNIINKILERKLETIIIASCKDWSKKLRELKTTKRIIVKNTFKILEKAKNGKIFAEVERGIFLFFINSELKDFELIKEWRDYLDSLNPSYKLSSFNYDEPLISPPKKDNKKIKNIIYFISFLFFLLFMVIHKEFLPIFLSAAIFLLLFFLLVLSQIRLSDSRVKFWIIVAIVLQIIDQVFGINYVEIANKIYWFLSRLIGLILISIVLPF